MGPLASVAIPAGAGLIGSLINSGTQGQAANAAAQATSGQNAIDQQLVGIYNGLYQDYQKNYQPLEAGTSAAVGGLQGAAGQGGDVASQLIAMLTNPQVLQQLTGINTTGETQGASNYFQNTGGTQAQAVGGNQINAANQLVPQVSSGAQTASALQQIDANQASSQLSPIQQAENTFAHPENTAVAQTAPGVINQLLNTGGTHLAGTTPGVLDYLLNPSATNLSQAAPGAQGLYDQTMATGISPDIISEALNQNNVATKNTIATTRNSLGAALPNLAGSINNLEKSGFNSNASLGAQMAQASQGLKLQAAGASTNLASTQDTQTQSMFSQALAAATGLDTQTSSQLEAALTAAGIDTNTMATFAQGLTQAAGTGAGVSQTASNISGQAAGTTNSMASLINSILGSNTATAGTLDAQTQQMLLTALGIGNQANQTATGNQQTALSTSTGLDQLLNDFINSGKSGLTTATSGLSGIGQQYGTAASNAATAASTNPFASFATSLGGLNWGSLAKPTTTTQSPTVSPLAGFPQNLGTLPPGQLTPTP